MKTLTYLACTLAVLLGAASLSAAPKEQPAKTPLLMVIPGDPGRPFKVIDNVAGIYEVFYKVTFTKGVGGKSSYQDALLEAFRLVREAAKESGADAVINTQIDYIPFPDGVIKDEVEFRGQRVIGLIKVFGTQVKFLPDEAKKIMSLADIVIPNPPLTPKQVEDIKNNLHQFESAADQYYLESTKTKATYADLVGPSKYIREVKSVAGEDYTAINFEYGKPLTVTTAGGEKVTFGGQQ